MENQDLLTHVITLFDSFEKWNAFIELSNSRGEIRRRYFDRLKSALVKSFINDQTDWCFQPFNTEQYRWFLKEFGSESICLLWRVYDLVLWCNPQFTDVQKVKDLLNSPDYNTIFNCFETPDSQSFPNLHHFCEERHRFKFSDGNVYSAPDEENHEKLAWFAGNMTMEMVEQISTKIKRFQTPEITSLLKELNDKCKKPM